MFSSHHVLQIVQEKDDHQHCAEFDIKDSPLPPLGNVPMQGRKDRRTEDKRREGPQRTSKNEKFTDLTFLTAGMK